MALKIRIDEGRAQAKTLVLDGRLDQESVDALDAQLDAVLASGVKVLVFDLAQLEYIASAGLRSIFRAHKALSARGGKSALLNAQPQVRKVFEIVKVADPSLFRSIEELDAYLDAMQKKVTTGD